MTGSGKSEVTSQCSGVVRGCGCPEEQRMLLDTPNTHLPSLWSAGWGGSTPSQTAVGSESAQNSRRHWRHCGRQHAHVRDAGVSSRVPETPRSCQCLLPAGHVVAGWTLFPHQTTNLSGLVLWLSSNTRQEVGANIMTTQ